MRPRRPCTSIGTLRSTQVVAVFLEITDGAFDITYAGVGQLYDYRRHIRPTEAQIRAALPTVNWRNSLDPDKLTVKFAMPGMRIDVGGIGKGYAVDRCIGILQSLGIAHALVTAGGDSRIIGDRDGRPWIVGIRHPDDPNKIVTRLPLVDTAMSTSGTITVSLTRTACATTTSSIRTPDTRRVACAAPPFSGRLRLKPTAFQRPRSCSARRKPWRSSTACRNSMRFSLPRTAGCIRMALSLPRSRAGQEALRALGRVPSARGRAATAARAVMRGQERIHLASPR